MHEQTGGRVGSQTRDNETNRMFCRQEMNAVYVLKTRSTQEKTLLILEGGIDENKMKILIVFIPYNGLFMSSS